MPFPCDGVSRAGTSAYPQRLAMIDDAPPLFAARGNLAVLGLPMVAIVGARNASAAGVRFAERLARELGEAGFAVVSGLARGIERKCKEDIGAQSSDADVG
jgi:DNA processing protein